MDPGEHVFPFEFALPSNLPSSYESHLGSVRYTIKGIIDRPWKFDHEVKSAFTVVSMYDLNTDPRASVIVYNSFLFNAEKLNNCVELIITIMLIIFLLSLKNIIWISYIFRNLFR